MRLPALASLLFVSLVATTTANANSTTTSGISSDQEDVSVETPTSSKEFGVNVTSNPFYLFFGGVQAGASFRLNKGMAAGPVVSTMSFLGSRMSSFGAQGQYALQGQDVMSGGWIIDSSVQLLSYSFDDFLGESYSHRALLAEGSADWQWFWSNGFNARLGGGVAMQMGLGDGVLDYSGVSGAGATSVGDSLAMHLFLDAEVAWAF